MVASGRYPLFIRRGGRVSTLRVSPPPVPCGTGLISRLPAGHGSLGLKNYASKKVLAVLRHRPETATPDTQIKTTNRKTRTTNPRIKPRNTRQPPATKPQ